MQALIYVTIRSLRMQQPLDSFAFSANQRIHLKRFICFQAV